MFKKYDGYPSRFRKPGQVSREKIEKDITEETIIEEDKKPNEKKSSSNNNLKRTIDSINIYSPSNKIKKSYKYKFRIYKPVLFGIIFGFCIAVSAISISIIISDFKNVKKLSEFQPNITTNIYDKNGLIISELFRQKREVVELSKIPDNLINAFIAIEDNEFYDHFGINPKGIVRAFFINIFSGRIKQGGSTITQQLAKILLTSRERNIFRKIKEAFISIMIELKYSKNEILELYFNQIFLGHGVYGVESASKFYFNKHVWDLSLAESALLATLPSAPNRLSPIRHTERSIERHKIVLAKMADCGFTTIPEAEKVFLKFWPKYLAYINDLSPTMTSWSNKLDKAPWFTEYIRRRLIKKFGENKVYRDGISVYTTLDLKKQLAAQRIMQEALERQYTISNSLSFKNENYIIENYSDEVELFSLVFNIDPKYKTGSLELKKYNDYIHNNLVDEVDGLNLIFGNNNIGELLDTYRDLNSNNKNYQGVEGCLISIDQNTGYIEALVGGREFSSINQLNRVEQTKRQPGSAIKPLYYAAAIESREFTPASIILDTPLIYLDTEGLDWIPENYEERYYGSVRLHRALEKSINTASIRIADKLGIEYITEYIAKLLKIEGEKNIKRRIPRNLSIALGSFEVEPYELARAYAIIANGGKDVVPFSIRFIKDRDGKIIDNTEEKVKKLLKKKTEAGSIQIINPDTAAVMISMLKSVMTSGTGIPANFGWPACGKTGSTSNYSDAWFVGFSPIITTCIWTGYDNPSISLGMHQAGGVVVAPIWAEYMKEVHSNEVSKEFPVYAELVTQKICAYSGLLPSPYCNKVIDEVFIEGTVPEMECDLCRNLEFDIDPQRTSPKENLVEKNRESILKKLKDRKDDSSIFKNVGDDILE